MRCRVRVGMMGIRRVAVRMLQPVVRMHMAVLSGNRTIVRMGMVAVAVVMPVLVRRNLVDMPVPVALRARKIRPGDHHEKRQHKRGGKALAKDQNGEQHPDEGARPRNRRSSSPPQVRAAQGHRSKC